MLGAFLLFACILLTISFPIGLRDLEDTHVFSTGSVMVKQLFSSSERQNGSKELKKLHLITHGLKLC